MELTITRSELKTAVTGLSKILPTFPGHDRNAGDITVVGREGRISIAGRGQDAAEDTVLTLEGGSTYEGAGGHIGINRAYLMDALAAGFRTFSFIDSMTPLKCVDDRGGTHVLMPLRTEYEPVVPAASADEVIVPASDVTVQVTNKENEMSEKTEEMSALDRLQVAYETARQRIRDANSTLADLAGLIKEVAKEDRQRKAEVESVRSGLAKLQAIKV
jgi:hypothetical protein